MRLYNVWPLSWDDSKIQDVTTIQWGLARRRNFFPFVHIYGETSDWVLH